MKHNLFNNSYEVEYNLVGIVSNLKEYRLAWVLNNILYLDLLKANNLRIKKNKNNFCEVSNYFYKSDECNIRLIKNKIIRGVNFDNEQYLIKKLSKFDYLFQIYDYGGDFNLTHIINKLNSENSIQFANFVDMNFIKEKDLLLI